MSRVGDKFSSAGPAESKPAKDTDTPPTDLDDWGERLRIAGIERAKLLAAKAASTDVEAGHEASKDRRFSQNISLVSQLKAARATRKRALAGLKSEAQLIPNPTLAALRPNDRQETLTDGDRTVPVQPLRPSNRPIAHPPTVPSAQEVSEPLPLTSIDEIVSTAPAHQNASSIAAVAFSESDAPQRSRPARKYALVGGAVAAGIALAAFTLPWTTGDPASVTRLSDISDVPGAEVRQDNTLSQRTVPASGPIDLDLVVVVENGTDGVGNQLGDTDYELRVTPFEINHSSVEYFNDADTKAAVDLAKIMDAEVVDLRGIQPAQPPGRVFVYLSSDGF